MDSLQIKVSKIREASLRNSISWCGALDEFFNGHTFDVLQCIWEFLFGDAAAAIVVSIPGGQGAPNVRSAVAAIEKVQTSESPGFSSDVVGPVEIHLAFQISPEIINHHNAYGQRDSAKSPTHRRPTARKIPIRTNTHLRGAEQGDDISITSIGNIINYIESRFARTGRWRSRALCFYPLSEHRPAV
ncbi:hypothetical protein B0H19DRAFT_1061258 [Mycena capillaripes]|nr:hypothetical protein B0H19DRAFT_1061258 [Mycena capillaripes]